MKRKRYKKQSSLIKYAVRKAIEKADKNKE